MNPVSYSRIINPAFEDARPCCANPMCSEVFEGAANDTTCPRCTGLCVACWTDNCECLACGLQCSSNCACVLPDDDGDDSVTLGLRGVL